MKAFEVDYLGFLNTPIHNCFPDCVCMCSRTSTSTYKNKGPHINKYIISTPFCSPFIERRIGQLTKKPLQAIEFIAPLARMDPVYKEEEESYRVSTLSAVKAEQVESYYSLGRINPLLSHTVHRFIMNFS